MVELSRQGIRMEEPYMEMTSIPCSFLFLQLALLFGTCHFLACTVEPLYNAFGTTHAWWW